jgi:hypothetical protein
MPNHHAPRAAPSGDQPEPENIDALLDEALTETFPASDPVAIEFTRMTRGRPVAAPEPNTDDDAPPAEPD